MSVITIAEANSALNAEVYTEWDALDDPFKQLYLDRASAFVRLNWVPPAADLDFDWDDQTTWDDEVALEALIAQYADATREGIIYALGASGAASTAPIKRTTEKVGGLEITTEYAQADEVGADKTTGPIDDQMEVLGFTKKSKRGSLQRV